MSSRHINRTRERVHWIIIISFSALAFVLGSGILEFQLRPVTATYVPTFVDTTPVRPTRLRPEYRLAGFTFHCNECHRSVPVPYVAGRGWTRHMGIDMKHGINRRCFNCHDSVNREAFIDGDENEIPWNRPELLCAKCHGPVFRDWQHGSHGRINGYWDTARGPQTRRKCVECHDPHDPAFRPLSAAPAPKPPRGQEGVHERSASERNPLRMMDQLRAWKRFQNRGEHE